MLLVYSLFIIYYFSFSGPRSRHGFAGSMLHSHSRGCYQGVLPGSAGSSEGEGLLVVVCSIQLILHRKLDRRSWLLFGGWPKIALSSLATWTSLSGSLLPQGVRARGAIERVYWARQKLSSFVIESWTLPQHIYFIG